MTERIKINKIVGFKLGSGEVYILNDVFKYNDGFKGACGAILEPVTQSYIDENNDIEFIMNEVEFLWKESSSRDSLREYSEQMLNEIDGLFLYHDTSYINTEGLDDLLCKFEGAVTWNCIGGGRCFDLELFNNPDFIVINQDLVDLIKQYETKE